MSAFRPNLISIVLVALGCLLAPLAATGASGELVLAPTLARELNAVLQAGDALRVSLNHQSEEQTDIGIRDLLQQIERARALSHLAKPHERNHLIRILDAARENFEVVQTTYGADRRSQLEEGYNQLVNLVRIYKLDRTYAIFFCPKDKTSWVQKVGKPQSPFTPASTGSREPCGMRIPK
ncbi:MAG: hypothetical protein V4760_16495 [Bdellovibrionota bacterium]